MTLVFRVQEGERRPRGYGLAWWDLRTNEAICMPVPVNLAAGVLRRVWHACAVGLKPSAIDAARMEGWRDARSYNHAEMRARVLRELDQEHEQMTARVMAALRNAE
jgi:hypothetical protein